MCVCVCVIEGCLNPITIIIPNGTLLSPSDTAAVVGGKCSHWILFRNGGIVHILLIIQFVR
jgi:N-methylhydantoinase B/oxoprolinase/acetone carboxylase alpha subunit